MVLGTLIIIISFALSQIFDEYSVWFLAAGFPAGIFLIAKSREKSGLKNKDWGEK